VETNPKRRKRVHFQEPSSPVIVVVRQPAFEPLVKSFSSIPFSEYSGGWGIVESVTKTPDGEEAPSTSEKPPSYPLTIEGAIKFLQDNGCINSSFLRYALSEKTQDVWYKKILKDSPLTESENQEGVRNRSNAVTLCVYSEDGMNPQRFMKPSFVRRWPRWLSPLTKIVSSVAKCEFNHMSVEHYPFGFSAAKKTTSEEASDLLDSCGVVSAPRKVGSKIALLFLGTKRRVKFENATKKSDSCSFHVNGGDLLVFDAETFSSSSFRPVAIPSMHGPDESIAMLVFEFRDFNHPVRR
jgi:hypothetical protein